MGEWVEWNGGEQPVDDDTRILVRYRDAYHDDEFVHLAQNQDWVHDPEDPEFDIVAYRIVS